MRARMAILALVVAGLLLSSAGLGASGQSAGDRPEIISVKAEDLRAVGLAARDMDILFERDGRVFVVAEGRDLARLGSLRIPFLVESARFAPAEPRLGAVSEGGINGAYHTAHELEAELLRLASAHPGIAAVREIGRSLEDRPLYALKVSDRAAVDETEPAVLLLGCHHAREWISVEVPLLIGRHLVESYGSDAAVRALVDAGEVWIVPLVNPDGLEYSVRVYRYWRKNRRDNGDGSFGVDLNRNYGYMWGYDDAGSSPVPASAIYRGRAPFSEPETDAVRRLFLSRDFRAVLSYHNYSQIVLYPWGYINQPTPKEAELSALARRMADLMAAVRGTAYATGRASAALYVTNGDTTDWTFGLAGIPSFTVELPPIDIEGGGFFNSESDIEAIFRENLPAALDLISQSFGSPSPGTKDPRERTRKGLLGRGPFRRKDPES